MSDHDSSAFQFPAAPDVVAPRDGRRILFSKDFHFITQTLETWSEEHPTLWEFESPDDDTAGYFFEDAQGRFRHPLSGKHVQPPADIHQGECFKAREKLHRHLTEDFFYLRCLLAERCKTDLTLCFEGTPLLHAGETVGPAVQRLNARLSHPIDRDDDPILDHLGSLRFTPSANQYDVRDDARPVCPLDGPVTPLRIGITTPMWTWKAWCGCSWEIHACPECLGELGSGHLAEE